MKDKKYLSKGFTLLEILLVVAAIGILAGIVIVAINPTKQLGETRNAQRRSDVNTILNAIYQYALDNSGVLPSGITTSAQEVCIGDTATTTCTGASPALTPLNELIWAEKYLVSIPRDPQCPTVCSSSGVGYTVTKTANGRVTVSAPDAEQGATISVTR